jgi:tetratricopeptide (TPR) repeat protein
LLSGKVILVMCVAAVAVALSAAPADPARASVAESRAGGGLERQFQFAVSHYKSGQYEEARQELEELVTRFPNDFEIQELLGLVLSAEGQNQAASLHFEKAVRLRSDSAAARANLAVSLARLGKNGLAEAELRRAVQIDPNSFDVNHECGEFYLRVGQAAKAVPYLETAERLVPSSYNNGYDLALAYAKTGQGQKARSEVLQLLKVNHRPELHSLLGEVEEKVGNYAGAINEYQTAVTMEPTESNIFDLGSELLACHDFQAALEIFSKGTKRYPDSPRLAIGLGLVLYLRNDYNAALEALIRATDLAPTDPRPYYFLSKTFDESSHQTHEVVARFRRYAALEPQNGRAIYYYAMSLWRGEAAKNSHVSFNDIESLLKKAVLLDSSFPDAHLALGDLYSARREYDEAVTEYQDALELNPNLAEAAYRLGQAYVRLGKKRLAEKEFQLHEQLEGRDSTGTQPNLKQAAPH